MLRIENEEHMRNVEAFANKLGPEMRARLDERLAYLGEYAGGVNTRCRLFKDFAPASFEFVMERRACEHTPWKQWFHGGLIFHGPHDGWGSGSAPTFAVTLSAEHGWSVHT